MKTTLETPAAATTQTATHTPGPWRVVDYAGSGRLIETADDIGNVVCSLAPVSHFPDDKGNDPDARLIAAAPDMLKALQACAKQLADCQELLRERGLKMCASHLDLSLEPARAAIARATGTT